MRRLTIAGFCVALALVLASPASASTLTITDTFGGSNSIWTLTVQTGCTTCSISLSGLFQDPDGAGPGVNGYTGKYIDAVQWVIAGATPTNVGFLTTTAGTAADWSFAIDASANANGCGGGASDNVCGAWISGGTGAGFGPIVNGSTLTWNFSTTFDSALPATLTSGNIRAAFNNSDGQNFNIFSPNGGNFGGGGGGGGGTGGGSGQILTPEPTSLLLLGSGLSAVAYRIRRKKPLKSSAPSEI